VLKFRAAPFKSFKRRFPFPRAARISQGVAFIQSNLQNLRFNSLRQARRTIVRFIIAEFKSFKANEICFPRRPIDFQTRRYDRRVTHREEHLFQVALQVLPRRPVLRRPQRYIKVGQAVLKIGVRVKDKKKEEEEIGIKKKESDRTKLLKIIEMSRAHARLSLFPRLSLSSTVHVTAPDVERGRAPPFLAGGCPEVDCRIVSNRSPCLGSELGQKRGSVSLSLSLFLFLSSYFSFSRSLRDTGPYSMPLKAFFDQDRRRLIVKEGSFYYGFLLQLLKWIRHCKVLKTLSKILSNH